MLVSAVNLSLKGTEGAGAAADALIKLWIAERLLQR
jgi:hypothetical protein